MAEFTKEFKVDTKTEQKATYKNFIEGLRRQLGVKISHNVPQLPCQERHPTRWFDLVLRTDSHRVRLRLRRDNIYLTAYQADNQAQWWEFDNADNPGRHLITGSNFLGFNGRYGGMANAAGVTAGKIILGQQPLIAAVDGLATAAGAAAGQARARALIVVIQMTCESIRSKQISAHFVEHFQDRVPAEPPRWILALARSWDTLSEELLGVDANPLYRFQPVVVTIEQGVPPMRFETVEAVAAALGLMKGPAPLEV